MHTTTLQASITPRACEQYAPQLLPTENGCVHELKGYPDDNRVPEYRRVEAYVHGQVQSFNKLFIITLCR